MASVTVWVGLKGEVHMPLQNDRGAPFILSCGTRVFIGALLNLAMNRVAEMPG